MSARRLLLRHFLRQFASFEGASTGSEAKYVVIALVSLVAGPGYLAAVGAARGSRGLAYTHSGHVPPELWLWKQEWLLLAVSLVAVTALVAVQWRSFVLGRRDYRILALLPIRHRTVMAAKLQSLVAVVLLLHLAINTLPGLWLPVASPFGYFRAALALQAALLLQTAFACAAIVALQGMVSLALPPGASRRVSAALQAAILLAAALLFVAEGSISRLAFAMRDSAHAVNWVVPVVWFRALYLELLGVESASGQARLAVLATVAALLAAVPCSLLGFRDKGGEGRSYSGGFLWFRLDSPALRARPVARAVSFFVEAALRRSPNAGLIARGFFILGVALTLSGLIGLALRDIGYSAPVLPARPLHAPAFVLPFFALVGLRLAAVYPAALEANWIFRLTETASSADYAEGVRRASLFAVALPLFALLAVPYGVLWGPLAAAAHLGLALAVALVTVEWLFLGFPKIPFTCSYQPGKANLRVTWPRYAAIFFVYCGFLPSLSSRLQEHPVAYVPTLACLLVAWRLLARRGQRQARSGHLVFDDAPASQLTVLDLDWRERADRLSGRSNSGPRRAERHPPPAAVSQWADGRFSRAETADRASRSASR